MSLISLNKYKTSYMEDQANYGKVRKLKKELLFENGKAMG
jgi:hypothetical protein